MMSCASDSICPVHGITIPVPDYVQHILDRISESGHEAFIVGGCVRDALLGLIPKDYDVCTSAIPEEVKACFLDARVIETGISHGTVTVLSDGHAVEITTYRIDGAYADHRRPDMVFFTPMLREDLARRDFTINAMAYHPVAGLIDPFHGHKDLMDAMLRCVGNPDERFKEDALRILRALRFMSRFSLRIEEKTEEALFANCHLLLHVSMERVLKELSGMVFAKVSNKYVPVLQVVLPELYTICVEESLPGDTAVQFAALLRGLNAQAILKRLKASTQLTERVVMLVSNMESFVPPDTAAIRQLLHEIGPEAARQLLLLQNNKQASTMLDEILERGDCYAAYMLAVNGYDMIKMGLSGKAVGMMLDWLLDQVMENSFKNERDTLMKAAQARLAKHNPFFDS